MSELSVFARISVKRQYRAQALSALEGILQATRAEPGCRRFELNTGDGADPAFYLVEHWSDDAALDHHYTQPYVRSVFAAYEEWLEQPVEITRMRRHG